MDKRIPAAWVFTNDVYNDKPQYKFYLPDAKDWKVIEMPTAGQLQTDNGYFGRGYYNTNTGQVIIAHRGTDDWNDWKNNAHFPFTSQPSQFDSGNAFREFVGHKLHDLYPSVFFQYMQTGHSLGGAVCQYSAAKNSDQAISFDNPGIGRYLEGKALDNYNKNLEVLVGKDDFANHFGKHSDNSIKLDYSDYDFPKINTNSPDFPLAFLYRQTAHRTSEIDRHLWRNGELNVVNLDGSLETLRKSVVHFLQVVSELGDIAISTKP